MLKIENDKAINKMKNKRGRPPKNDKRDNLFRLRLNTEERQMLTQTSEWTGQTISAVIRTALHAYYQAVKSERNIQPDYAIDLCPKCMDEFEKFMTAKLQEEKKC